MADWVTTTTHEVKPTDYKLVQGLPATVEKDVKWYLERQEGWHLNGEPMLVRVEDKDTIVQSLVKYTKERV